MPSKNFFLYIDDIYTEQQFKSAFYKIATQLNLALKHELQRALLAAQTVKLAEIIRQNAARAEQLETEFPGKFGRIKFAAQDAGSLHPKPTPPTPLSREQWEQLTRNPSFIEQIKRNPDFQYSFTPEDLARIKNYVPKQTQQAPVQPVQPGPSVPVQPGPSVPVLRAANIFFGDPPNFQIETTPQQIQADPNWRPSGVSVDDLVEEAMAAVRGEESSLFRDRRPYASGGTQSSPSTRVNQPPSAGPQQNRPTQQPQQGGQPSSAPPGAPTQPQQSPPDQQPQQGGQPSSAPPGAPTQPQQSPPDQQPQQGGQPVTQQQNGVDAFLSAGWAARNNPDTGETLYHLFEERQDAIEAAIRNNDLNALKAADPALGAGMEFYLNGFKGFDANLPEHQQAAATLLAYQAFRSYREQAGTSASPEGFAKHVEDAIKVASGDQQLTQEDFNGAFANFKKEVARRGGNAPTTNEMVSSFAEWFMSPETSFWPKLALLIGVPLAVVGAVSMFTSEDKLGPGLMMLLGLGGTAYGLMNSPVFGGGGLSQTAQRPTEVVPTGRTQEDINKFGYEGVTTQEWDKAVSILRSNPKLKDPEAFLRSIPDKTYAVNLLRTVMQDKSTLTAGDIKEMLKVRQEDSQETKQTKLMLIQGLMSSRWNYGHAQNINNMRPDSFDPAKLNSELDKMVPDAYSSTPLSEYIP